MAKANYNCAEQELYTCCDTGWISCEQHQTNFVNYKPKYTLPFIQARRDDINAARALPDEQQRNDAYETSRIQLLALGKQSCDAWQTLKRYISDAYPPELQKSKTEAAGQNYYTKASANNWDSVKGLLTSGSTFITANLAALTANDNMPPAFQAAFDAIKLDFEKKHNEFIQAEEEARIGAETKILANNKIYADLISMLLDGQEIFKNEEAIRKQFIFAELLYLASGAGTAGFKGTVTPIGSTLGLEAVTVSIKDNGKTATTNSEGKYEINQLPAGTYTIKFNKEGYLETVISNFIVKVGTVSTLNAELTPDPK
jgi:hypothetical protein